MLEASPFLICRLWTPDGLWLNLPICTSYLYGSNALDKLLARIEQTEFASSLDLFCDQDETAIIGMLERITHSYIRIKNGLDDGNAWLEHAAIYYHRLAIADVHDPATNNQPSVCYWGKFHCLIEIDDLPAFYKSLCLFGQHKPYVPRGGVILGIGCTPREEQRTVWRLIR